jgi:DNA-binding transcriptional ArsR family regulator
MDKKVLELEKVLKAVANRRRIAIVRYVRSHPQATLGDVSDSIKLPYKSASKHVSVLLNAEILHREQQNSNASFSIHPHSSEYVRKLISIL